MGFKRSLALLASAGSGKTFALSVRYISLLFLGESPANIFAGTFTNKAASEMRSRILRYLKSIGEDKAFLNALIASSGLSEDEIMAKAPNVLKLFLASEPQITTLDSLFSNILHSASTEIGLNPDFQIKEGEESDIEELFLRELNREGLLGVLVELAIDLEIRRVSNITNSMKDWYSLDPLLPDISFKLRDISELEKEIEELRDSIYQKLLVAKASNRAQENFKPQSVNELFAKSLFAKESLYEHSWYKKALALEPTIEIDFQELKRLLREWARAREAKVLDNLFKLYNHYKNSKIALAKSKETLDFNDLGFFAYRLLYKTIERDFLYFRLDARFKHILLDEFQDTSTLQFLLLKPLIDEIFAGIGQEEFRSFFYVGDTKQSLYRFRGGVEDLFNKVAKEYSIEIDNLKYNYRSSKILVDAVNRWFNGIMPEYILQEPNSKEERGYLKISESDELIASAILEVKELISKGVEANSIAILVHTNRDGINLQEAFASEGIGAILQTSSSLKSIPEIVALVKMANYCYKKEPIDAVALEGYIRKDLRGRDFSWFNPYMKPVAILHRLIDELGYFANDANILRLLEFASNFSDLPTFLEEFERSKISVATNTLRGVTIMTIHGSKGLEFDYVIVLDRLSKQLPDNAPFMLHYNENLYIDKIFYRISKRDNFDKEYESILKERAEASKKDRLNLLYVALTRAKDGLVVIKKLKNSIFDILPMELGEFGTIEVKEVESKEIIEPIDITIGDYGVQERPISSEEDEQEGDNYRAKLFGLALHYTLEVLGKFDIYYLPQAIDALRNRYGTLLSKEEIKDIEERIKSLLENSTFLELISDARLSSEQPLSYKDSIYRLDLLVEKDNKSIVIDYKSSKKFNSKHKNQVRYYLEALRDIENRAVEGYIVYLESSGVEVVRV